MPASGDLSSWPSAGPPARNIRMKVGRSQLVGGVNGTSSMHQPSPVLQSQAQIASQQGMSRPMAESATGSASPVLYLLSLNGTFERKTISVPFSPDTLRIGRQTNAKTVPTPVNGFFDSKVLSRQHAEIWADRQGKVWIRDVKSSNGTFVNGTRLSLENRESEPHELQTGDHLELGIDIVSEDQKTVVHHKVAAKVEHAGFLSPSSNLLDMNFGDLDPSNGTMMMQSQGMPYRGRNGSQGSMTGNGRVVATNGMMGAQANGIAPQRGGFFFSPISTEQIVKKLQNEMRTARLQSQDLNRTGQFINALLSKDDVKDMEKPEHHPEPLKPQMVNGNGMIFRTDSKARFSDPPAPPPQQPLPEKPDIPSLKRGTTERPKSQPPNSNASPIRHDPGSASQILALTEALNKAQRDLESQTFRMRELEEMLRKEQQARELAEELAKRLEDASAAKTNGTSTNSEKEDSALEEAFEPPVESSASPEDETPMVDVGKMPSPAQVENIEKQLESMVSEMQDLKQQLEAFKQRAETAEGERDEARKSLVEMALQIRRDAEAKEAAALEKSRSRSHSTPHTNQESASEMSEESNAIVRTPSTGSSGGQMTPGSSNEPPDLSRANTITRHSGRTGGLAHEQALANSLPYASVVTVVLIGIGLMTYLNTWQAPPPRLDR